MYYEKFISYILFKKDDKSYFINTFLILTEFTDVTMF